MHDVNKASNRISSWVFTLTTSFSNKSLIDVVELNVSQLAMNYYVYRPTPIIITVEILHRFYNIYILCLLVLSRLDRPTGFDVTELFFYANRG